MLDFVQKQAAKLRCSMSIVSAKEPKLQVGVSCGFDPESVDVGFCCAEVSCLDRRVHVERVPCTLSWSLGKLGLEWVDDVVLRIFAVDQSCLGKVILDRAVHVLFVGVELEDWSVLCNGCFNVSSSEWWCHDGRYGSLRESKIVYDKKVLTVRQQCFEESIQSEMMANFERKASMERLYRRKLVRCDVQLIKCSHVGCANDDNHFFRGMAKI